MAVLTAEAPGGTATCAVCPTCSKHYPYETLDRSGQTIPIRIDGRVLKVPDTCERCGSPMDEEAAWAFQDKMAQEAASPRIRTGRKLKPVKAPPVDKMERGDKEKEK